MEFLRFGSSIPGSYWGCCACDIIQNFKFDPDAKASIQIVNGDAGVPCLDRDSNALFVGPTYRDIFWQRLRFGTFDRDDMPNHAFIAILTQEQVDTSYGKKWLALLKEAGFEFIRTVTNSVYSGDEVAPEESNNTFRNYIFMLVRNIGSGNTVDQFKPPKAWTELPSVVPEAWKRLTDTTKLTDEIREAQLACWDKLPEKKFMTEKEVVDAGAPVILAGQRIPHGKQQTKTEREQLMEQLKEGGGAAKPVSSNPFLVSKGVVPALTNGTNTNPFAI